MKSLSRGREYALVLLLGAAGAGLVLLSVREGWADVVTPGRGSLPAGSVSVTGEALVPAAPALALAALAGLAGVIATKGRARQVVGAALAVFGVITMAAVSAHLSAADVLAAARPSGASQAGSAIAGSTPGASGGAGAALPGVGAAAHVVTGGAAWRAAVLLGALMIIAAGAATIWRGRRWPVMSDRYDAPTGRQPREGTDTAGLWESLSRGVDPTEHEPADRPGSGDGRQVRTHRG